MAIFGWIVLVVISAIAAYSGFVGALFLTALGGKAEVAFPTIVCGLGVGGLYLAFVNSPFWIVVL